MQAEKPAKGVLKIGDWGTSKMYKAVCDCGNDDCSHTIDIEADETGVTVTVYTQQKTNFWSKTRWYHIWQLLTKGQACFETSIVLGRQSALNYAATLKDAVKSVEEIRNERKQSK